MARTPPTIERVSAPTPRLFQEQYVARRKPVILTDVVSQWPAFANWNPDYLREVAGDATVDVHYDADGDFQRWYSPEGLQDRQMTLREFVDLLTASPPERRFYMTEHSLARISERLVGEVDAGGYADPEGTSAPQPYVFLGRDTMMPLHYHGTTEAILCQIVGDKEIVLYPPEQTALLRAHPWRSRYWHFSRVGAPQQASVFTDASHLRLGEPNSGRRFESFDSAEPMVFTLRAGEILFIPVHWWHLTTCPGFQINVTFFWPSRFRRYRFPQPGLQVVANGVWKKLTRLGSSKSPYG